MEVVKVKDLQRFNTLEVSELGELKLQTEDEKYYIDSKKQIVNYLIKNRDREWVNEEYKWKHWDKFYN